jgi:hypothetical protein
MSVKFALAGLAALGGVALAAPTASAAMPNGLPTAATQSSGVENVRWVCGPYRCWWQPSRRIVRPYAYGPRAYYGPRRSYGRPYGYGGGYGYGPRPWRRW